MKRIVCIIITALLLFSVTALMAEHSGTDLKTNGQIRTRTILHNLHENAFGKDVHDQSFIDTRMRMSFISSFSKDLSATWQVEVGDITWGVAGGSLGTDGINVETKNLYLDWKCTVLPFKFRAGLQGWNDNRKLILGTDVAGITAKGKFNDIGIELGTAKLEENSNTPDTNNDDDKDLFFLTFRYKFFNWENIIQRSNGGDYIDAWIMPNIQKKFGPVDVNLEFVYNYGSYKEAYADAGKLKDVTNGGYGLILNGKMKAGPVDLACDVMYTSGDDGEDPESTTYFKTVFGNYYTNGLEIFGFGPIHSVGAWTNAYNDGKGLTSLVLTGKYPLKEKLTLDFAGGYVMASEKNEATGGKVMGTEVDLGITAKPYKPMSIKAVISYAMPGAYYKDDFNGDGKLEDADDVYKIATKIQYNF